MMLSMDTCWCPSKWQPQVSRQSTRRVELLYSLIDSRWKYSNGFHSMSFWFGEEVLSARTSPHFFLLHSQFLGLLSLLMCCDSDAIDRMQEQSLHLLAVLYYLPKFSEPLGTQRLQFSQDYWHFSVMTSFSCLSTLKFPCIVSGQQMVM